MRLTTVTNVSLVWRDPRAPTGSMSGPVCEDGPGKRTAVAGSIASAGGPPLLDDEALRPFISRAFQRADAFLVGRRTVPDLRGLRGRHGSRATPSEKALNRRPSTSPRPRRAPGWAGTTVLSGVRPAAAIGRPRAEPGGSASQARGSGTLIRCGYWTTASSTGLALLHLSRGLSGKGRDCSPPLGSGHRTPAPVDMQSTSKGNSTIQTHRTHRARRAVRRTTSISEPRDKGLLGGDEQTPPSRAARKARQGHSSVLVSESD